MATAAFYSDARKGQPMEMSSKPWSPRGLEDGPDGQLNRLGWRLAMWYLGDDEVTPDSAMPDRKPDVIVNWGQDVYRAILWFGSHAPGHLNWLVARLRDAVHTSVLLDKLPRRKDFANNLRQYVEDVATVQLTASTEPQLERDPVEELIRKLDPTADGGPVGIQDAAEHPRPVAHAAS